MAKAQVSERRRVAVNVSLDPGLLAQLDAVAEREGASRSQLLRRLLRRALEDEEREDTALAAAAEAAYHDPDNQGTVPWEQVKAESRSLP